MRGGVVIVLLSVAVASAQTSQKTILTPDAAVVAAERRWAQALEKADAATLAAMLADTYVDTDESGHRTDKNGVLGLVKSGDLKMTSLTLTNMQPRPYGNTVVITGDADVVGTFLGKPLIRRVVFTDVFVRQNGKWMAVASQRSPIN
jgi:hypothetical protein